MQCLRAIFLLLHDAGAVWKIWELYQLGLGSGDCSISPVRHITRFKAAAAGYVSGVEPVAFIFAKTLAIIAVSPAHIDLALLPHLHTSLSRLTIHVFLFSFLIPYQFRAKYISLALPVIWNCVARVATDPCHFLKSTVAWASRCSWLCSWKNAITHLR